MYDGSIPIHHIFSPIFLHMAAHLILFNILSTLYVKIPISIIKEIPFKIQHVQD